MNQAIITLNDDGAVTAVTVDGLAIEFTTASAAPPEWNPMHVESFLGQAPPDAALAMLARAVPPFAQAAVPWSRMAVLDGDQFATGVAYVLPADVKPQADSFFPLNCSYAGGYSMVEVEPLLDVASGTCLSREFFLTDATSRALARLGARLRAPLEARDIPGFVHADTVALLRPYSAAAFPDDPLLNTVAGTARRASLADGDFVAFAYADWAEVSPATKALDGHRPGSCHYYCYVRRALPIDSCDQLRLLRHLNHKGLTWRQLATCPPFRRALEEAHRARHALITETLAALGLQPRRSAAGFIDTDWDVLDASEVSVVPSDDAEEPAGGIVFFSGVSPSHVRAGGVLIEAGDVRQDGLLWLHGPPSQDTGGDPFHLLGSVNSLPSRACGGGKLNKRHVSNAGWDKAWGHATIQPIAFI